MPASIWLIPPPHSPIAAALQSLISTHLPPLFAPEDVPHFVPHMTLTSRLPENIADPQELLNQIEIPTEPVEVVFSELNVGETFFTRLTLHVEKSPGLVALAQQCREKFTGDTKEQAEMWATEVYTPHVSLVYSSFAPAEVPRKAAEEAVEKEGIVVKMGAGESALRGWEGGKVVLVPTWKALAEWKVLGERVL